MSECKHITKELKMSCGFVTWQDWCNKHGGFISDIKSWSDLTGIDCPCKESE